MIILYSIDQSLSSTQSVIQKIKSQIILWHDLGNEVLVFSTADAALYVLTAKMADGHTTFSFKVVKYYARFRIKGPLLISLMKSIDYELVYTRWKVFRPFMISAFETRKRPYILEINSYSRAELRLGKRAIYLFNLITESPLIRNAAGLVCVTKELADKYSATNSNSIVIANGVCIDDYPFLETTGNSQPNIAFIGTPNQKWHGLDKICQLADIFRRWQFHVIGTVGENTSNLHYHGYLELLEANRIIARCDIGICSLSLYTKKMAEACPLKARQYLAMGIPIIYAYDDPDLRGNEEFVLKIPNTPDNINTHLDAIENFIYERFGNTINRISARMYAASVLNIKPKEQKRIDYFNRFIHS